MKSFIIKINDIIFNIYIGNTASENWKLIDNADDFDLWFHIDDDSSSHVIIKQILEKNVDIIYNDEIIKIAAEYCKLYSKYKNSCKKIKIIYSEIKNIKKGKCIGSVLVSEYNSIYV